MYISAGKYENPSAENGMGNKNWRSSDLIFDLDADHFPDIDPEKTNKRDMLKQCKEATQLLLNYLREDFAFENIKIVFSGNRGYHIHVRDESIQELNSAAREEIADYVRAHGINIEGFIRTREKNGVTRRELRCDGGWGQHLLDELIAYGEQLAAEDPDTAKTVLTAYDNIGKKGAETLLETFNNNLDRIKAGNMEVGGPALRRLYIQYSEKIVDDLSIPIDAPVTTDTHRLIRLPHTLHGGSGLIVKPVSKSELSTFDPLTDAIPDRFKGREITISANKETTLYLGGETHSISNGEQQVPEYVGINLMAQDEAEKVSEFDFN